MMMSEDVNKTIVLVGLMGAGKTSVGKLLAAKLGIEFMDIDHAIEEERGLSVTEIFEKNGEDYFRELEKHKIQRALAGKPKIVATGGGAFINEEIRRLIKESGISVWIRADFDILLERVSRKNTRPLLEKGDKAKILQDLMEKRYPVYEEADITVDSTEGSHDLVVNQIVEKLKDR